MMATEQPVAHMEEQQQNYDEGEMGEGEEEVSRNLCIPVLSACSFQIFGNRVFSPLTNLSLDNGSNFLSSITF